VREDRFVGLGRGRAEKVDKGLGADHPGLTEELVDCCLRVC
jgi:hypothetical protein